MRKLLLTFETVAGWFISLWVAVGIVTQTLVVLMALDVVTGLLAGFAGKVLASTVVFRGMVKKAVILCVILAVHVLARGVGTAYGIEINLGGWVAAGFCIHEFLSIIENAGRAGVTLPKVLVEALEKLKAKQEPTKAA